MRALQKRLIPVNILLNIMFFFKNPFFFKIRIILLLTKVQETFFLHSCHVNIQTDNFRPEEFLNQHNRNVSEHLLKINIQAWIDNLMDFTTD